MKRSYTRSLVRVTCLAALLSLGCAAVSFADPDPTGGGFQGVPDEIQTRLPPPPTDPLAKKYNAPAAGQKKGGPIVSSTSVTSPRLLDLMIRVWQLQLRYTIQH